VRVNISYSINFEEVPDKVNELLDDTVSLMNDNFAILLEAKNSLSTNNLWEATQKLEKAKLTFGQVGDRLAETYNMLLGYQKALISMKETERNSPQATTQPPSGPTEEPVPTTAPPANPRKIKNEER